MDFGDFIIGHMINPFEGIEGVLFDMDGTLVETNIDFGSMKRQMIAFAEKYGLARDYVQGMDILAIVDSVELHLEETRGNEDAWNARSDAFRMLEEFEIEPSRNAREVPNAVALLDALRSSGIKVGIVTRNCRRGVQLSMQQTGVSAEVLLTRDDVKYTKPHPEHLLAALELLNVVPSKAVMVGDHWMDVQGGKAAGMRTIGFLRPDRPDDFFEVAPPDIIIRDLGELLPWIHRLKKGS